MKPLELVMLPPLMERTSGSPEVTIGLIDGPVAKTHPALASAYLREIPGHNGAACTQPSSVACVHGTFVTGILCAKRGSAAPAICPNCTLLIHPIFSETAALDPQLPSAKPEILARAILACVDAGARVINLSLALALPTTNGEQALEQALDQTVKRGVLVVAAAGNQGKLGSTAITRHPWVLPVAACTLEGRPMQNSNFGRSIGSRGVSAPGDRVTSLGAEGQPLTVGGTSAAAPFVTGAIALLWSAFPAATAADIRQAIHQAHHGRRATVIPPVLNAWAAYHALAKRMG
jgi:subtilisin family serine protease